jgi:release factor glutamine methyltransferase
VTLREAIDEAADRLSGKEDLRENAQRDAELLLLHVLGATRTLLFMDGGRAANDRELAELNSLLERRLRGEPIQYIIGEQEFYGLPMKVTPAVLIPRPETELLVEAVLERLPKHKALRIVDVGTGSGAIAVAVAKHLPLAEVVAVDLSAAALEVARGNAASLGLGRQMRFLESDLLAAVAGEAPFDAVLSNPPYIPVGDRASLHRQVREHEPATALFAGEDGLEIYRRLVPQASAALKPGGLLALEIGYGQQAGLEALLHNWNGVQFLDDLQGVARTVLATKT